MAEATFYSDDRTGYLHKSDETYATAQAAAAADDVNAGASKYINAGQKYALSVGDDYDMFRGFTYFDTSTINADALIKSAKISVNLNIASNDGSDTDFDIVIRSGMPTYPHDPGVVGDYDIDHSSGNGGEINTADISVGWNDITLTDLGKTWINRTGTTKLYFISSRDINTDIPNGDEYINLNSPKLIIEYYLPTGIPVVQSVGPCIDIQSTTMTAVGNVTDDGGGYEERGFEYYEDVTSYDAEMYAVRELGVFTGTGNFEMTIYGLKPETTYQIRAWVRNSYGTTYGDWYTCTTKAVPGYSIYEEANSATICFYLSEDDGMTWGQKHGPYTEDQADIEITKLLVRGSGKKKIKFESDVLTGISVSVMVKLDCKAR